MKAREGASLGPWGAARAQLPNGLITVGLQRGYGCRLLCIYCQMLSSQTFQPQADWEEPWHCGIPRNSCSAGTCSWRVRYQGTTTQIVTVTP